MTLILRLRAKGKHEPHNSSEQHRTYENTRGFDNSGVGEHPNTDLDTSEYETPVPGTSEYETPEHTQQYGKCNVSHYVIVL